MKGRQSIGLVDIRYQKISNQFKESKNEFMGIQSF